jgi:hypothetical protein
MTATCIALRLSALLAGASQVVLVPGVALAQTAETNAPAPKDAPVTLLIHLPPDSPLDAGRLEGTIARELGAPVVRVSGAPGGTLMVTQDADGVVVSFEAHGRHDSRSIALAGDPAQAELDIALVAVNVARDQAAAFLPPPAAESPPPPPSPPPATPRPATPAPHPRLSPCARLRDSSTPRSPLGLDFVPFAGTSSLDGGRSARAVSVGALGTVSNGIGGAALSGLVNVDAGPVCGAEIAGLVNVADGVQGAQIGGILGVTADDSAGTQISLINVAGRLRGVQIGLINVANDTDVQIGLVNIDLHGRLRLDAWAKPEAGMALAGIKHGTAHFHTVYAFEMNTSSGRPWAVFGLGVHLTPLERFYVDIDVAQHTQLVSTTTSPNGLSEVRALVGYTIAPRLSAFVGPTYNVLVATDLARADAPSFATALAQSSSTAVRAWPGVAVGLEGL